MTGFAVAPEMIALAHALADAARPIVKRYFRTPVEVDDKADASPVTIADREVESAMRAILTARVPSHGILGEEWGAEHMDAEWVWVLDPIDGTKAFITGMPSFGTLIALCRHGRPVLGIIDQAITDERWVGAVGHGSSLNGQSIHTRACPDLSLAYAYTTDPAYFQGRDTAAWGRVSSRLKLARYSSDCYGYALLATGFCDLVIENGLKPYDYAALAPVIEGAGGIITDWAGQPLSIASNGWVCAAGDARLHAQALGLLTQS